MAGSAPAVHPLRIVWLCRFCIEVTRTLVDLSVPFVYYRLDQLPNGAAVSTAREGAAACRG